ncbi:MAG: 2-oxoacid:ferredoxin oxidoreductase subunit beta [archaeon]|nr:MAG: 2-oxoacid:ferredoxin oxidoreductase subunit beta [archaeon]
MKTEDYKRKEVRIRWCDGCGLYMIYNAVCAELAELNFPKKDTYVISGIGCAGRSSGYFDVNSLQALHGRTIPVAVGIKEVKPHAKAIVFSGDGDLLAIGLNHLLHASRRNDDIKVFCSNNEVYAMTGGQRAPTTPIKRVTTTSPYGNQEPMINIKDIILSHNNFFARSSTAFPDHLTRCVKEAMKHKGFSFVDIKSQCPVNVGRKLGMDVAKMLKWYKERFKIKENVKDLKEDELGIIKR